MTVWPFLKKKKLKKKKFLTTKAYKLGNLEKIKIIYNVCPKMIKEKINLEGDEKPEEFLEYIRRKISVFSYVLNEGIIKWKIYHNFNNVFTIPII